MPHEALGGGGGGRGRTEKGCSFVLRRALLDSRLEMRRAAQSVLFAEEIDPRLELRRPAHLCSLQAEKDPRLELRRPAHLCFTLHRWTSGFIMKYACSCACLE